MTIKKLLIIIGAFALGGLFYYAGYWTAARMGKEKCIATVTENCLKICGVGAEFCYPDKEDREFNNIEDPEQDSMIAGKWIKLLPPL